jgi:hypothetical protein
MLLYGLPWEKEEATEATNVSAVDSPDPESTKLSAPESAGLIWGRFYGTVSATIHR